MGTLGYCYLHKPQERARLEPKPLRNFVLERFMVCSAKVLEVPAQTKLTSWGQTLKPPWILPRVGPFTLHTFMVFWTSGSKPLISKLISCFNKELITSISQFVRKASKEKLWTSGSSSDANKHLRSKKLLQICSQRKNTTEHQPLGEGSRTDSTLNAERRARGLRKDHILNKRVEREAQKIWYEQSTDNLEKKKAVNPLYSKVPYIFRYLYISLLVSEKHNRSCWNGFSFVYRLNAPAKGRKKIFTKINIHPYLGLVGCLGGFISFPNRYFQLAKLFRTTARLLRRGS